MKKLLRKIINSNKIFSKILVPIYIFLKKDKYQEFLDWMSVFYDEKSMSDKKNVRSNAKEAIFCHLYYNISFQEYFLYKFYDLSHKKKREFIGEVEYNQIMKKISEGKQEYKDILRDKYKCYLKFKDYYRRDIIKINGDEDRKIFDDFLKKHSSFLVKPIYLRQGQGIYIINKKDYKSSNDIWNEILKHGSILLEEIIIQNDGLGRFHPKSVNTVRVATYNNGNKVIQLFAVLRMGRGNSIIDNACAGGIVANIDLETGIVISQGMDYATKKYLKHPDTNICIMGYQIPQWKELCETVEQVSKLLPEYNYISWDFALTEKGWTIVEANSEGAFRIYQSLGNGIRKKFEEASKKEYL